MVDWKNFFQTYRIIEIRDRDDLLYQVGMTVGGEPISQPQFSTLIKSISDLLRLSETDSLLDLCCGNGVITFELAKKVKEVTGIDISRPYIDNAITFKKAENINYFRQDITQLDWKAMGLNDRIYDKITLYSSLAYLSPDDLEKILAALARVTRINSMFMIGAVLDSGKKWRFFNTPARKLTYLFKYRLLGKDAGLGRWWTKTEIEVLAGKYGYDCLFYLQDPILHTAHYRFDCVLTKRS